MDGKQDEAQETAEQRLTALSARLERYTREAEAARTNSLFPTDLSRVYSQLQWNNSNKNRLSNTGKPFGRTKHQTTPMLRGWWTKEQTTATFQNKK